MLCIQRDQKFLTTDCGKTFSDDLQQIAEAAQAIASTSGRNLLLW